MRLKIAEDLSPSHVVLFVDASERAYTLIRASALLTVERSNVVGS